MPNKLFLIGGAIFGASVLLVLVLLVTNGGANKSRQFEVIGDLLAGRQGPLVRGLLFAAFAGIAIGAITLFTAVGRNDEARRKQCNDTCVAKGFKQGALGLSAGRDASGRPYKVCRCTGGSEKDQEIDPGPLPE